MKGFIGGRSYALVLTAALLALVAVPAVAPAQTGPPEPDEARFQKVLLEGEGLTQPMRIKVAPDGRVVYIERDGRVKVWDPVTQSTKVAGAVAVRVTGELGLVGLELAPDFDSTGHIYLHYSRPDWQTSFISRVSRFTLTDESTLDPASEVPIIDIRHPQGVGGGHSAGDLRMTADGLLFIVTGDNTNCCAAAGFAPLDERPGQGSADAQKTSANTNDLNGKILRVRPRPEGGYDIPDGNLFGANGVYPGVEGKTRPEIYAMGFRNPFTLGDFDPATGALWMADYGPDAVLGDPERGPAGHVEVNLITQAGFFGWPYCIANNTPYRDWNFDTQAPKGDWFDCAHPVNDSPNNTGLVDLPPAQPATIYWTYTGQEPFPELFGGGAMAGPRYQYDAGNPSKTKFPEWFDGRRFLYDWTTNWIQTTRFADDLKTPVGMKRFLGTEFFSKPMDLEFGPDGALYVLEYGNGWGSSNDDAGLYRIDYVEGNRTPRVRATASANSGALPLAVEFDASNTTDPDGDALQFSWDFDGDGTADAGGATVSHTYTTAGNFQARVTVTDGQGGSAVQNFSVIAGNTRPTVKFTTPIDGRFSEFGDSIPFKVQVTDPEDGAIDCTKITVTYSLGHNEHAHPMAEATPDASCQGVLVPGRDAAHGPGAYVYHVIQATYTDNGGAGGTQPLLGEDGVVLHPRTYEARTYPRGEGVGLFFGQLFVPGSGNWFMFPRINVADIDRINLEIATRMAGVKFTVHADSPTGPVVATVENIPYTGSTSILNRQYKWFTSGAVNDPGGVHDLYFVTEWAGDLQPEVFVRTLQFITAPEKVTATVAPAAPNGSNGWYTSPVTVKVDTGGAPLWTRQVSLDGGTTWTNTNAAGEATVDADGTTTVRYRAIDSAGTVASGGSLTVSIDKTAPAPTVTGVQDGATYGDSLTRTLELGATDATSGVASTTATLDGRAVAPGALRLYQLALGEHTFVVTSTDVAGNTGTTTLTFTTDTSFADMRALIDQLASNNGQRTRLTDQLNGAEKSAARGATTKVIHQLREFKDLVQREHELDGDLRTALLRDADAMINRLSTG
jgi:glucose/arabinose dehydrogenase/PKD repeat protein